MFYDDWSAHDSLHPLMVAGYVGQDYADLLPKNRIWMLYEVDETVHDVQVDEEHGVFCYLYLRKERGLKIIGNISLSHTFQIYIFCRFTGFIRTAYSRYHKRIR